MLVLSRKADESIYLTIGGMRVKVTIVKVSTRHGSVRIGIEAPQEVTIHRQEVQEAIDREKERGC